MLWGVFAVGVLIILKRSVGHIIIYNIKLKRAQTHNILIQPCVENYYCKKEKTTTKLSFTVRRARYETNNKNNVGWIKIMVTASSYLSSSYSSLQCYIRIIKITPKVEIEVRYVMDKKKYVMI